MRTSRDSHRADHPPEGGAAISVAPPPGDEIGTARHAGARPRMELLLRVCVGPPGGRRDTRSCDVVVGLDAGHRVGELAAALGRAIGGHAACTAITVGRTGAVLDIDAAVVDVDLVSGDELLLGSLGSSTFGPVDASTRPVIAVDVIAGPDTGRSLVVDRDRCTVGRRSGADLDLTDPSVSRDHAELAIDRGDAPGDRRISIRPAPDSVNGVTVNDVHVHGPTPVAPGAVIGLGATRLVVRPIARPSHERTDRLGQIGFHRTPYRPPRVADRSLDRVGPIPERPEPRRLHGAAVLAPLVAGLIMYLLTRQVTFLVLTLVSPVVVVATLVDDRRSGRRSFGRRLADFRDALCDTRIEIERLRSAERIDRFRASPDLADLIRRAEHRTVDLWPRGRAAPDFLVIRLGLGTSSVRFEIGLQPGGDEDVRAEADAAMTGLDTIDNVPVTVDLRDDALLGLHGDPALVDGLAASVLMQAATLHSPEDLTIVAAVSPDRSLDWLKWLPHVRSVASPLSGNHLATTSSAADGLVDRLVGIAMLRTAEPPGQAPRRSWPRVLVVLDGELGLDPAETSRLLDVARHAGMSIVWLAPSLGAVPHQVTRVLEVRSATGAAVLGRLWSTDPTVAERMLEPEHLGHRLADRGARALAPLRDASTASTSTSIPRAVPLLDVLGTGRPTREWVAANWERRATYGLGFPIGTGSDGVIHLDLVGDGPHALIGGTSGAGKSELLQTLVVGLAVSHPPTRLNILFIDYKGGASSHAFERLPHGVGRVTNLSPDMSLRALTSLRAELDRRMGVLAGRAKDLEEMLERFPDEAPASLVIVVDEFATLVDEVPDFVAGIIDIARRGRSLGIHLVLATQRPSGSVNDDILANTNLRISLRVLERTESTAIIDSHDAAEIPVPLRGRAFARLGPGRLVEFQGAFAGAPLVGAPGRRPICVVPFERTGPVSCEMTATTADADGGAASTTHLDAVLEAIADADAMLALPAPRRPWRDVLPALVTLDRVLADEPVDDAADRHETDRGPVGAGRFVTFGLLDAPERQEQRPAVVDLEEGGGWLIFGTGGSGKTTLLRTVAASVAAQSSGDVAIVAFDFASRGLAGLRSLPAVAAVAPGDDLEAVTRHLLLLEAEIGRRRRALALADAEDFTAFRRGRPAAARIVVLIDGLGELGSSLLEAAGSVGMSSADEWSERVRRLVVEGRAVGIHTVATADRRNAVPSRLHAAISNRLVLRLADDGSCAELGVGAEWVGDLDLPPGRGLLHGRTLVQVAVPSDDPSARGQQRAIDALAARGTCSSDTERLRGADLPRRIREVGSAPRSRPRRCTVGIADVTGAPVTVDLDWSHLVVCGPPRSGRSTALAAVVGELVAHHELAVVALPASPLTGAASAAGVGADRIASGRGEDLRPVLAGVLADAVDGGGVGSPVVVVDDADALDDAALASTWERLAGVPHIRVVMSLEQRSMSGYATSALVSEARRARRLLVLQPDDPAEFLQTTGVRLPVRPGLTMVPGRGVLLVDRRPTVVQIVDPIGPRDGDQGG